MQSEHRLLRPTRPGRFALLLAALSRAIWGSQVREPQREARRLGHRLIGSQSFLCPCAPARSEGASPGPRLRLSLGAVYLFAAPLLALAVVACDGSLGRGIGYQQPQAEATSFNDLLDQHGHGGPSRADGCAAAGGQLEDGVPCEPGSAPQDESAEPGATSELDPEPGVDVEGETEATAEEGSEAAVEQGSQETVNEEPQASSEAERETTGEVDSTGTGEEDPGIEESSSAQTEALPFDQVVDVGRVSVCHQGELDLLAQLVWLGALLSLDGDVAATWPEQGESDRVRLSLEADDGRLLGSARLQTEWIMANAQMQPDGSLEVFPHPVHLEVPVDLLDAGSFNVSLFVCYDLDEDGACGDEQLGNLNDMAQATDDTEQAEAGGWGGAAAGGGADLLAYQPRVFAHVALRAHLDNGELGFERYFDETSAFGAAAGDVAALLDNFQALAFGLDAPLSVVLAAQTADEFCPVFNERTSGCFVTGTRILVGPGLPRAVEELGRGAQVLTFDGRRVRVRRAVSGPEPLPVVAIATASGTRLTVTSEHPMMTVDGLKPARTLSISDRLLTAAGAPTSVISLSSEAYAGLVYNFELPGSSEADHLVVAEGLVTGDLHLQQQLAARSQVALAP